MMPSQRRFRYRIGICKRESRETKYWLRMIARAAPAIKEEARAHWREAKELHLIFASIIAESPDESRMSLDSDFVLRASFRHSDFVLCLYQFESIYEQTTEHRPDRLRLYGPGSLGTRIGASITFSIGVPAGAESRLCADRRVRQGVRRQMGVRVGRDRLAKLLARKDIEAVDICVPNNLHAKSPSPRPRRER